MKTLLGTICLCFIFSFFGSCDKADAGQKNLTMHITKDVIEADLAGFNIYEYDSAHNPTGRVFTVLYTGQNNIVHTEPVTVPDDAVTKLCYTATAYDFSGNESAKTVIVDDGIETDSCAEIDFEAPGDPTTIIVTIVLIPE